MHSANSDDVAGGELFLDTSIPVSMLKGEQFRSRVDAELKKYDWVSVSSYSKMEYGNVVLSQATYFLRRLNEGWTIDRLGEWVGNNLQQKSKATWFINLVSNVLGSTPGERSERARLALQRLINLGTGFLDLHSHNYTDGTECSFARWSPGSSKWSMPNCKRAIRRCRLDTFFEDNRTAFAELRSRINKLKESEKTEQLTAFSHVIGEALDDPTSLLDYKSGCKRLADAIIGIESRDHSAFFTMNDAESKHICQTLAQNLIVLRPSPEKGIEYYVSVPVEHSAEEPSS